MTLNQTQTDIVSHVGRLSNCLLVTGAPGTGKTTALVAAVAGLVRAGAPLDQIVVLAHARPAAFRLRRQVMAAIGVTQAGPRITTVHGWCRLLVNAYAEDPTQHLLSAPEQEYRVRELLPATRWPADLGQAYLTPAFAGQVRALLTRARQLGLDPAGLAAAGQLAGRADWMAAAEFFEGYLDVIDSEGVIDYAELVHRSRLLLAQDAVAAAVAAHTKAVLVDDFAECDESIAALLRDIWRAGVPVTAFADPSTRILDFRGAWPGAVSRFPEEFAGGGGPAPVIQLGMRWRQVDTVQAWVAETPGDEPTMLAEQLWRVHAQGVPWQDMAVIGRAGGRDLNSLARGMADAGVPVRQEGESLALADVPAVRLILAGIELVVALSKGEATEQQWLDVLGSPLVGLDLIDLRRPDPDSTAKRDIAVATITSLAAELETTHFSELAWGLWTLGDWPDRLRRASLDRGEAALRADRDLDAVIALFDLAGSRSQFTGAAGVEAVAALVGQQVVQRDRARETDDPLGVVTVLSAYGAKGREWPVVAVCGAVEGAWPMSGSTWSLLEPDRLCADGQLPPTTRGELVAAQRRLFALATSRASRQLIITGAPLGDGAALPSRFIAEIGLTPKTWRATGALPLAPRDLVGQLRAAAVNPDESPGLVDAATALLGRLADLRCPDGRALVTAADPSRWWWVGGLSTGVDHTDRPVRLVASSVWLLLGCPRRWFVEKQAGASPSMGDNAWLGQLAHWAFETYATTTPEAEELAAALRAKTADLPLPMGWRQEAQWQELLDCFERYRIWRDGRANRTFVATETSFVQHLATSLGPVEVHGRVDRLELDRAGRLVVIDFKTSRSRDKTKYSDQLNLYTLAARHGAFSVAGAVAENVALPELVWPGVNPRRNDVGCPVDQSDDVTEAAVMERIERAVAIIRSERFPATPGDDICRSCAFTEGCPATTALAGVACIS